MAKTETSAAKLATRLWNAKSVADIERIIELAEGVYHGGLGEPRPVGDRPNNIGTIRAGSDPALGLVERVTNGQDALLDLARLQHAGEEMPKSPREAAKKWFGVPAGGVGEMTDTERRSLGEKLTVWLDESGDAKRPTVGIQDEGTGQSRRRMSTTLLSLNESNKVGQPWTMGTYGQGGAVTFGFSNATVIISRRDPDFLEDSEADVVSWTIVQEYENDPETQMLPSYKYLVGTDNEVLELDPALFPGFEHGTRVLHIGYDLQRLTGPFTTGLWQFFHSALFDPVLPFLITGKREKEKNYGSRIIIGNAARLANPEGARGDLEVAHSDSVHLDLGNRYGSVTFNYWVVTRPEGSQSSGDAAASYVEARSAVSMTLFGQRQDTETRAWVKDRAMLPFLYKNMVVQIDADALTPVAKREMFASTRERATQSELRETVYTKLADTLRTDDELKRLNHVEKERLLKRSTSASSEKVRKRLAQFIKNRLKDMVQPGKGGSGPGDDGGKKTKPSHPHTDHPRNTDDQHLPNVPTKIIFERTQIRVNQGATAYTWVEIDAKNGYLPEHDDDLSLAWTGDGAGDKVKLRMWSKLLGGKTRWVFEGAGDAKPGDYTVTATLITSNGVVTSNTATITVAVPPKTKPTDKGTEPATGPRVVWVNREDWGGHNGMNAHTVGYVTEDLEETIIFVNRHWHLLEKALSGRKLTAEMIDTRATRYQYPVACALWLQANGVKEANPRPDEKYEAAEKERMAEAVLVAIDPDVDVAAEEGES